ncbi:MAG: MscL family protein [Actinomycetota bacterium]|jgi:large conductance mechanosensitive channel|nr:MscL family protein [Actinomycetota bacterium]
MLKGFKNFLNHGSIVVTATGLVVALAFSTLIQAFTINLIDPLVNRASGSHSVKLGVQLGAKGSATTFMNFGAFISAIVYFIIFMVVIYVFIVSPYRRAQARQGNAVFGQPAPTQTCPYCLSSDLPLAARRCLHCTSELPAQDSAA